jgi:translation initiation factor 5B
VDHGKCIALDEPVLLNNDFSDGSTLLQKTIDLITPEIISESERSFDIPNFRVFSLDPKFELVSVPAKLFVQNYSGPMIDVHTKDGKRIKVSPEHPLLMHTGNEIQWRKAKDLRVGDYVGALKKLPESPVVKDPHPNWKEGLSKSCWVVKHEDAVRLSKKTNNFRNFENLTTDELNSIRILYRKSFREFEKECGSFHKSLASQIKKGSLSTSCHKRIVAYFTSGIPAMPIGTLINLKNKSHSFVEINDSGVSSDILRFLALIVSESNIGETKIQFAQDKNILLDQYYRICKEKFNLTPSIYGNFDHKISNKAWIEFLKARYGIIPGNSRKSGIPSWIFSLPNDKLAIFLRTFFSAEANVNSRVSQIALIQANKRSIQLIGYSLKKFGILHSIHPVQKCATNTVAKIKREYWQLIISGQINLKQYRQFIGFDLEYKQKALDKLCLKKGIGKKTDRMIPVNYQLLSKLVEALGLKKRTFSERTLSLKDQEWFFAYQDCRSKMLLAKKNYQSFYLFLKIV